MDIGRFLSQINERHGTTFHLQGRYADGENEGAYALADAAGVRYVLKRYEHEQIVPRLERARTITAYLRSKGAPVPTYHSIETLPDGPTYAILSALPGAPSRALTNDQLQRFLALNDLQEGQAISHEQNWSSYATAVVFDGESGWADSLRTYSQATRSLLNSLQRLVMGKEACCAKTDDIVHGDLSPGNVLVEEGRVSGIVDWDAAGCGDRAFDLAKVLYYSYKDGPIRQRLRDRILELSSHDTLRVYMVYNILAQLDWSIHHHQPADVDDLVIQGHAVARDLGTE